MNLLNEIEKDAKQFMRERRTLLLLVAAPMLVLFVVAAIFGGDSAQAKTSAIGICDFDSSNASQMFVLGMKNNSQIIDYASDDGCADVLRSDVSKGKLAAGLVIPSGFESGILNGSSQNISLMLDNSRFQVSPSIEAFVSAAVQKTDEQIGTQFISSVWQRLGSADAKLGSLLSDINDTRERAKEMRLRLHTTYDSLDSLNISGVRSEIYVANSTISEVMVSLDRAQSNLTDIESNFANYSDSLNQTASDLITINDSLSNISGYISSSKSGVNCSDLIFKAYCLSLDSLNSSIASTQASVENRIDKVHAAQKGLVSANQTIQDFKANAASARLGAVEAQARLSNMLGFVDELDKNRQDALQTISDVDTALDDIETNTYKLESIISDSRGQIREVTSMSPDFVISPMLVASEQLFGQKSYFTFMLPSLLPLILMFVALFLSSTSLVREKHNGTLTRIHISQVNPFIFSAMKIVSYSLVLLPEAILLSLIASAVYGAFPLLSLVSWLSVVSTLFTLLLAFVSIGVLIAVYSESESTAFLASLVIGLPLLFLSGLLFPFEFMPQQIALLATASPLTQSVLSMQSALLYHTTDFLGPFVLCLYFAVFSLFAGLSLRKK